ncbi:MAG: helix-turn-helix domain-containing protein [Cytophagales bacterium]|nr:helix-turn-helix domain-containing protein [Cytophagales bacterium]
MSLSLHSLIFFVSTLNALTFSILAFLRVKRDKNNAYLGTLLLLLTFMFFDEFGRWTPDFFITYPQFTFIFTFTWFLFIPVIFIWIRYQTTGVTFKWIDLIHFVPVILMNLVDNQFVIDLEVRENSLLSHQEQPEAHYGKFIFSAQIAGYMVWVYALLSKRYLFHGVELWLRLSHWLKALAILFFSYFVVVWLFIGVYEMSGIYLKSLDIWKTNFFLIFIYGWLFYVIYKPEALKYPVRSIRIWQDRFNWEAYSVSLKEMVEQITLMQLYLQPDLGVTELSKKLKISGRKLTTLINQEMQVTVPQLINILRIKEMERRFLNKSNQPFSIEGLARDVGFKSKTSFYRSFKEFTGETPANYFNRLTN